MIEGFVTGGDRVIARLDAFPKKLRPELKTRTIRLSIALQSHVKQNKLSGQVLKRRTGTLSRSIARKVDEDAHGVTGRVGTNVKYAAIHEFGGKTKPHVIEPKTKGALAFEAYTSMGQWGMHLNKIIVGRVNHPGSQMPERSFLRSSLAEFSDEITASYREALDVADA